MDIVDQSRKFRCLLHHSGLPSIYNPTRSNDPLVARPFGPQTSVLVDTSTMSTTTTPPPTGASPTSPAATCTTAVPGANGHVPIDACNSYYTFDPSFAWNLAFTVLFGLTTVGHVWQSVTFRKRYCWVIVMGALWECLAFALRTAGSRDQQSLGIVIGHSLLLLLAPLCKLSLWSCLAASPRRILPCPSLPFGFD